MHVPPHLSLLIYFFKDRFYCLYMGECICSCFSGRGGQKRVSELLKLELQGVVTYLMLMLGTEPGSTKRTASTVTC